MLERNQLKAVCENETLADNSGEQNIRMIEKFLKHDKQFEKVRIKQYNSFLFEIYYLPLGFDLSTLPKPTRPGYRFMYWTEVGSLSKDPVSQVRDLYRGIEPSWRKLVSLKAEDVQVSLRELKQMDEEDLIKASKASVVVTAFDANKKDYQIVIEDFDWPEEKGSYDLVLGLKNTDIIFTVQVEVI